MQPDFPSKMDIITRLKTFMDANGIAVTQFADTCRIPRPTLSQLLSGRNKKVSDEVLSKIHAGYPRLSMLWLMFGEGNMETDANIETSEPLKVAPETEIGSLPFDYQDNAPRIDFADDHHEFHREKIDDPHSTEKDRIKAIDVASTMTGKGRRVISIVVYYDDKSYEQFVPDGSRSSHGVPM